MFWIRGVEVARANIDRYERQLDKAEFKYIIKSIHIASKHGFSGFSWEGSIRLANRRKLIKLGYHIINNDSNYRITW